VLDEGRRVVDDLPYRLVEGDGDSVLVGAEGFWLSTREAGM
jgi:hypothetical protein